MKFFLLTIFLIIAFHSCFVLIENALGITKLTIAFAFPTGVMIGYLCSKKSEEVSKK